MTRDDILRMAREAGWKDLPTVRLAFAGFDLERFAALVAAAERQRCAQIAREWRGLTDDEISALFPSSLRSDYKPYSFARAIEAALKEKNQ